MSRRSRWMAFLVLLCCTVSVIIVRANTVARTKASSPRGIAAPVYTAEDVARAAAERTRRAEKKRDAVPEPLQAKREGASRSAPIPAAPESEIAAAPEAGEKQAAWEAYTRWQNSGTATPAEKELISRCVFGRASRRSDSPLDNQGGPDAFGYRFVDNQNGDTATFNWIELCGDPAAVNGTDGDDAASTFMLSFEFPYYGADYTRLWVSTNGAIQLGGNDGFTDFDNLCIGAGWPAPAPLIFPYWDDQYASTSGGCNNNGFGPWIRFRDFGTYAVVEWRAIPHFYDSGDRYSYEAILYNDGKIKFQYHGDWDGSYTPDDATIGIEAPGGDFGVEYACFSAGNPIGLGTTGRAVWFFPSSFFAHDFYCTAITYPGTGGYAPGSEIRVSANFANVGSTTESAPISYQFNNGLVITEATPILSPGAADMHTFVTRIPLPAEPGNYPLSVWSALPGDENPGNDQQSMIVRVAACADENLGSPALPYTVMGTTCGLVNDHSETCLDYYDGGEDYIYSWTVTAPGEYNILLNANGTMFTGIVIDDECPPAPGGCIAYATTALGNPRLVGVRLDPGTYFIMVDTWPSPDCIPSFSVTLQENVPVVPDYVMDGPGTYTSNTCGALDDCPLNNGEDVLVQVNITDINLAYTFTLCNSSLSWSTRLYLTTGPCVGTLLAVSEDYCDLQARINCYAFSAPGAYYVTIEPGGDVPCGDFTLDVIPCVPCEVTCPAGAIPENEPTCQPGYVDVTNGGCNWEPNVFTPIALGQTVCATSGNYLYQGMDYTDTDWYEITLAEHTSLTWSGSAEFPLLLFIVSAPCPGTILATATADSCGFASVTRDLYAGTYYLWAGVQTSTGVDCGRDYYATVTGVPWTPPPGRCCYGDPFAPTCVDNLLPECQALDGHWFEGVSCVANPCPPCYVTTIFVPGSYTGSTLEAGNNCELHPSQDQTVAVEIMEAGTYTFTLCNSSNPDWDPYMFLSETCCGTPIAEGDDHCGLAPDIACFEITSPGTYYVTIESSYHYSAGPYTLDVQPCLGRCCYGDPSYPNCQVTDPRWCRELRGVWTEDTDCATPCPARPGCGRPSLVSQYPHLPDEFWTFRTSDQGSAENYRAFDDFSGLTEPVTFLRFWGVNLYYTPMGWVHCAENPMAFEVKFWENVDGQPGAEVCSYTVTGVGADMNMQYAEFDLLQYDLELDPPCTLTSGFVSIQGAGDPNCWFLWGSSPAGNNFSLWWDGWGYSWNTFDFAYCMSAGICEPVRNLRAYLAQGDPSHTWLHFNAPAAGNYEIYSTVVKDNDGDPDGGTDPDFVLEATLTRSGPGRVTWTDMNPLELYKNYVVVHDCSLPEPMGRCCYGDDPFNPQCQVTTVPACNDLTGTWTFGLTCDVPCPLPTYCVSGGICDEFISRVTIGTVDNVSVCGVGGYEDWSALSTNVVRGTAYTVTVENGFPYDLDVCGIWVDWNHDMDWNDRGETMYVNGNPGVGPYTASIIPPANALPGAARMRVRIVYDAALAPCGAAFWGETEDYTLNVE